MNALALPEALFFTSSEGFTFQDTTTDNPRKSWNLKACLPAQGRGLFGMDTKGAQNTAISETTAVPHRSSTSAIITMDKEVARGGENPCEP